MGVGRGERLPCEMRAWRTREEEEAEKVGATAFLMADAAWLSDMVGGGVGRGRRLRRGEG